MITKIRKNFREVTKDTIVQLYESRNYIGGQDYIIAKGLKDAPNNDYYYLMWVNKDNGEYYFGRHWGNSRKVPIDEKELHKLIRVTHREITHIHQQGQYVYEDNILSILEEAKYATKGTLKDVK